MFRATSRTNLDLVLDEIKSSLEHDNEGVHDQEMHAGIASALLQKLALSLAFKHGAENIIIKICYALGLVFQCSSHVCEMVFEEIGDDLISILVIVIDSAIAGVFHENRTKIVMNAVGALCCICRSSAAKTSILHHTTLFNTFLRIVSEDYPDQAKVNVLDIIGSIALAEQANNDSFISKEKTLVDTLTFCVNAEARIVRKQAAQTITNILSIVDSTESIDLQKMTRSLIVLGDEFSESTRLTACVSKILSQEPSIAIYLYLELNNVMVDFLKRVSMNDSSKSTRYYAITVLKHLFCDEAIAGKIQNNESIITTITCIAKNDPEKEVSDLAVDTLYDLVMALRETRKVPYEVSA